ncbi:putative 50S ribosomal protein L19 [Hibiscus syriacus]|uniref:50S ribosomal protein L19 n=1 Tax=Hibiscus syriacus TaxID=106335 RepID=A0A6A2X0M4_HIBSY|nr:putative 50S ribosomal protein L19 [Hibiscus syriacus]
MQDTIGIPACFHQVRSLVMIRQPSPGPARAFSLSVEGPQGENQYGCKVELKPWWFWRKQDSKRLLIDDGVIVEPEMEMRIDGNLALHVQHLEWKFRGNESINVNRRRLQVYWDVHDWLFSPGLRHALFIFKPVLSSSSSSSPLSLSSLSLSSQTGSSGSLEGLNNGDSPEFCLFLYAWKIE